jgi:2-polyprenyl-6-methoxyphenol hydroxylase-like FAD-dependent oxidoreductase
MPTQPSHAIVIGASLAGLWTARVLADHFQRVTVFERDQLPVGPASRPGAPQDRHVHVLLQRGALIMARLFPGIEEELTTAGAHRLDLTRDGYGKIRGRWLQRFPSGKTTYGCSRILLESIVRARVMGLPNVAVIGGVQVLGLTADNGRVTGVRVRHKESNLESVETADFVVDASGRTSKAPQWLAALGYDEPKETVIDARLGYAGRRYRMPEIPEGGWLTMLIGQEPPTKSRSGLIYSEEGGVWMVMVAGCLGDYPPTDEAGFEEFAASVDPEFYAAIRFTQPISKIIGYRNTENRFRRYEKLARWPDRFVVLGDAVCGFNPVYGQGMTVAAMAAESLGEHLGKAKGALDGLAWRYQRRYPKIVEPAWNGWGDRKEALWPSGSPAGIFPRFWTPSQSIASFTRHSSRCRT